MIHELKLITLNKLTNNSKCFSAPIRHFPLIKNYYFDILNCNANIFRLKLRQKSIHDLFPVNWSKFKIFPDIHL